MPERDRIDRILAGTGRWSRSEAKALIRAGSVTADGSTVERPESKFSRSCDIRVSGEPVDTREFTTLMMNKPAGTLSATEDPKQTTVLDLLPAELRARRLFPAGRLDRDTEGLLILTNDGVLAHRMLSPRNHVEKEYRAVTLRPPAPDAAERFRAGLVLADGTQCLPADLRVEGGTFCFVTVREGKFHQVKRMLSACGAPVLELKRIRIGAVTLDGTLAPGAWRNLEDAEIRGLLRPSEQ